MPHDHSRVGQGICRGVLALLTVLAAAVYGADVRALSPAHPAGQATAAVGAGTGARTDAATTDAATTDAATTDAAEPTRISGRPEAALGDRPPVTLEEAVAAALDRSPRVRMAEHRVTGADAARKRVRGRFGPVVRVEASAEHWDGPVDVAVPPPQVEGFEDLEFVIEPLSVRDQDTRQISASVIQPVTGLAQVWFGYEAGHAGVRAAAADLRRVRREVALDVTRAWFDALRAEALHEVARSAAAQLQAHRNRLGHLVERGLAVESDLLETEVRLSEARARVLRAAGGRDLARAALAVQMGLGADAPVRPAAPAETALRALPAEGTPPVDGSPPTGEAPPPEEIPARRPELDLAQARADQAQAAATARWLDLAPEISALAQLRRVDGSLLSAGAESFVGARLTWNVFEWGAGWYAAQEAEAQAAEARAARAAVRDGLSLELEAARVEARVASEQVQVARQAQAAAEEHVRLARRRHEAGVATYVDVLDAENLLTRARARRAAAVYDLLYARAALRHALGGSPVEGSAP